MKLLYVVTKAAAVILGIIAIYHLFVVSVAAASPYILISLLLMVGGETLNPNRGFGLVVKEIARRKAGFVLACLAVALATAGVVFTQTLSSAFEEALRRITKDMGRNIAVVPAGADATALSAGESGTLLMDEALVA